MQRAHPCRAHQFKSEDGGTKSLRFSYSNPPLQQMPFVIKEIGPLIRSVFLPEEGEYGPSPTSPSRNSGYLVHYGRQRGLPGAREAAEAYRNDPKADFHQVVAEMTGLAARARRRPINFSKIYGGGAAKIAEMIRQVAGGSAGDRRPVRRQAAVRVEAVADLPERGRAQRYTELYGGARRHWDQYEAPLASEGRRRRARSKRHGSASPIPSIPGTANSYVAPRTYTALNALIQGSAAIHTKLWMLACWREGIVPMLQMHDALESSVSDARTGRDGGAARREAVKLEVPMRVDLKFGRSWGDAEHSWEELRAASINGTEHHSQTLAVEPAIILPASPPSEETCRSIRLSWRSNRSRSTASTAMRCRKENRTGPVRATGTPRARLPNRGLRQSTFTRFG